MGVEPPDGRYCRRCKGEVERGDEVCPTCGFSPKQIGLTYTGRMLYVVPISWIVGVLLLQAAPAIASTLMLLGIAAALLCGVMYIFSMASDPYRFGRVFKYLP